MTDLVEHYSRLARQPGWYAYVRQRVKELEAIPHGPFAGLHAAVAASLAGFTPLPGEASAWWLVKNEAERGFPSFVSRPVAAPVVRTRK